MPSRVAANLTTRLGVKRTSCLPHVQERVCPRHVYPVRLHGVGRSRAAAVPRLASLAVVSMPAGMHLRPRHTRCIDWYFDARIYAGAIRHAGAVARYTSFCTPWDNPPV